MNAGVSLAPSARYAIGYPTFAQECAVIDIQPVCALARYGMDYRYGMRLFVDFLRECGMAQNARQRVIVGLTHF